MTPLIHDGDQYWTLRETETQRKKAARLLSAIYALCDPDGYDARKLREQAQEAGVKSATRSPTRSR